MSTLQPDIFIDAVILLTKCKDDKTVELVNQLLDIYSEDSRLHPENDTNINRSFVELLNKLKKIPNSETAEVERSSLLIQFLTNPALQQDNIIYTSIKDLFNNITKNGIDPSQSEQMQKKLGNSILINKCNKIMRKMFNKLTACQNTTDEDKRDSNLNDAINLARSIVEITQSNDRLASGAIERVDFSSKKSLMKSLELYNEREVAYKLQTGLQGLNTMLGERNAFALGECVAFIALNHNFKSGILMTVARGLVKYNTPSLLPNKGKPLILFVTLENEANRNVMWLYQHAYEQTYHKSSKGLSDEEIVEFVHSFFGDNGFHFIMERRDGSKFGYDEYVSLIESYEAQGYWVVASLLDYANKMKKGSSSNAASSSKGNHNLVGDLFSSMCTYHKTKGILFITAHQLNRGAQDLVASGKSNAVKYFGPNFIADSLDVSRELDLEVYMHLEYNQYGQRFLTCQRGKHRYMESTPVAHQYFAYPFTQYGIEDDINGPAGYTRDIFNVDPPEGYDGSTAKPGQSAFVPDNEDCIF